MTDHPRESFGSTATGVARFDVLIPGNANGIASWSSPKPNISRRTIPGSFPPRVETELISFEPSSVSWLLSFDTMADYWALLAKLATVDTLTMLANTQSHRGTYISVHGIGYVALSFTMLDDLTDPLVEVDGAIEASAVFTRQIDPRTGLAVPL